MTVVRRNSPRVAVEVADALAAMESGGWVREIQQGGRDGSAGDVSRRRWELAAGYPVV